MSARMETDRYNYEAAELAEREKLDRDVEIEALFCNFDQRNLVAPLRELRAGLSQAAQEKLPEAKRRAALALQEQWDACLTRREKLRNDIKRGKDYLEQVQKELTSLRGRLEDWTGFERVCGTNPLPEYIQSALACERMEAFLPGWLRRREHELKVLTSEMELCARQNGLEHML